MADGKNPVLILQGKVDSAGALEVVNTGAGAVPAGPTGPIGSLQGSVDSQGRLRVRVV